ncbi:aryl-sulfate sulfotransferase [bacterium]
MRQRILNSFFLCFLLATATWASNGLSNSFKQHLQSQGFKDKMKSSGRTIQSAGKSKILSNGVAVPSDFPTINTQQYGETAPGRIFFSSTFFDGSNRGNYLVICENDGTPYFYRRYNRYSDKGTADFRVQPNGLLSFHMYLEGESGIFYVMDQNFTHIDTFICDDKYWTDNHEFLMLPNGHALLIAEETKSVNMSQVVTGGNPNAYLIGNYIQELDSDGNLYWEWSSWDRLNIADAVEVNLKDFYIDYVHLNSIAIDYDGHYIISLRHYAEVAKIDSGTGDFIWRLGGVNNEFTFINEDTQISSQHHAMPVPGKPNHYTIYDNGDSHSPPSTRAIEYKIDPVNMTAEKVWEYKYDKAKYSFMMGSVQRLPNGNTYMDWSTRPPMRSCEVDSDNNLLFEMDVRGVSGYRSYRYEWEGKALKPDLIVENDEAGVNLIMNQFNDPDIDYFNIYHSTEPNPTTLLDTSRLTLKHLDQLENKVYHYFRVTSVNTSGQESDLSNEEIVFVKTIEKGENQILNHDFSMDDEFWIYGSYTYGGSLDAYGEVVDGAYRLRINSITGFGGAYVFQYPIELVEDETYLFEFDAWANQTLQIQPMVSSNSGNTDYSRIGTIQVSTDPEHYSYEFTKGGSSTVEAIAGFMIEMNTGELYVDNVVLKQIESSVEDQNMNHPATYRLDDNYPNPFNGVTTLSFYLSEISEVTFTLFDIRGKQIRIIQKDVYQPGDHRIRFQDESLSSGIYFYQMEAKPSQGNQHYQQVQKMIYLK